MSSHKDLDFEIAFFEELVQKNPDFVDALIALGEAYTKKGKYQEGLKIDQRLVKLKPRDPVVYYNLACSYSLLRVIDSALGALEMAIRLGYVDFAFMEKDSDLDFIRDDPRYELLLSKYVEKGS